MDMTNNSTVAAAGTVAVGGASGGGEAAPATATAPVPFLARPAADVAPVAERPGQPAPQHIQDAALAAAAAGPAALKAAAMAENGQPAPSDPVLAELAQLRQRVTACEATISRFASWLESEVQPALATVAPAVAKVETLASNLEGEIAPAVTKLTEAFGPFYERVTKAFDSHFMGKI